MWTTVYLARGLQKAIKIKEQLEKEGFLVKKKLFSKEEYDDIYEILVPDFEAEEVQIVLFELGII